MTSNRPVSTGSAERLIRKAHLARELGVSHAAISRACKDGRLSPALRQHNGHEVLAYGHARRLWAQCRPEPLPQALPELAAAIAEGLPPIAESRARRMYYLSELERIEVEMMQSELVSAADVELARLQCSARVRAALAEWVDRVVPQVVELTDPRQIHLLLRESLITTLRDLAGPG